MNKSKTNLLILLSIYLLSFTSVTQAEENPAEVAMQEYLEFADFSGGAITAEQLANYSSADLQYIDTRKAEHYQKSHIPGAIHIEWREILTHKSKISDSKKVILYCDTGLLSSKAQFALSVLGYENVRVLFGGYKNWQKSK